MNFSEGEMKDSDRTANAAAIFHPAVEAAANNGAYAPPAIEVGGVQVYVYVRDGILVISGHFDTACDTAFDIYDDNLIPVVVNLETGRVWSELPEYASEEDARILRETHADDPGSWPRVRPSWLGPDDS